MSYNNWNTFNNNRRIPKQNEIVIQSVRYISSDSPPQIRIRSQHHRLPRPFSSSSSMMSLEEKEKNCKRFVAVPPPLPPEGYVKGGNFDHNRHIKSKLEQEKQSSSSLFDEQQIQQHKQVAGHDLVDYNRSGSRISSGSTRSTVENEIIEENKLDDDDDDFVSSDQSWKDKQQREYNEKVKNDPYHGGGLSLRKKFKDLDVTTPSATLKKRKSYHHNSLIFEPLGGDDIEGGGWKYPFEFLITCISLSLGLANVWRLPTMAITNGHGLFVLLWVIMMFLVGFPLLYLEISLAYFSNKGPVQIWTAVPLLKGVGYAQILISLILSWYYPTLASYSIFYLIQGAIGDNSIINQCINQTMSTTLCSCYSLDNTTCKSSYFKINTYENCFLRNVGKWQFSDDSQSYNPWLLIGLFLLFIIVFLCIYTGPRIIGRITPVTTLISFGFLLTFLILAVSKPGVSNGILKLFDYSNIKIDLSNANIWISATVQALISLHLSSGITLNMASRFKRYGQYVLKDTLIIFFANLVMGLLIILMIYGWIGIVEYNEKISVNDNPPVFSSSFIFILFNAASQNNFDSNYGFLMQCIFSLFIFVASINSMIPLIYSLLLFVQDNFYSNVIPNKKVLAGISCTIPLMCSATTFSSVGLAMIISFDGYAIRGLILTTSFLFVFGFMFIYGGLTRLKEDFEFWMNFSTSSKNWIKPILQTLSSVVPIILLIMDILGFAAIPLDGSIHCKDPLWVTVLGWTLYGIGLSFISGFAIYEIFDQIDYELIEKIKSALKSDKHWGPKDPILQHQWHNMKESAKLDTTTDENSNRKNKTSHTYELKGIVNLNFDDEKSTKF